MRTPPRRGTPARETFGATTVPGRLREPVTTGRRRGRVRDGRRDHSPGVAVITTPCFPYVVKDYHTPFSSTDVMKQKKVSKVP